MPTHEFRIGQMRWHIIGPYGNRLRQGFCVLEGDDWPDCMDDKRGGGGEKEGKDFLLKTTNRLQIQIYKLTT